MAQGRSTIIISVIMWIWTSRLSIKNSLSHPRRPPLSRQCPEPHFARQPCQKSTGLRVWGSGFRGQGLELRVQGSGFMVQGLGLRVWGLGFGV